MLESPPGRTVIPLEGVSTALLFCISLTIGLVRRRRTVAGLVAVKPQHTVLAAAVLAYPGKETAVSKGLASKGKRKRNDRAGIKTSG